MQTVTYNSQGYKITCKGLDVPVGQCAVNMHNKIKSMQTNKGSFDMGIFYKNRCLESNTIVNITFKKL